MARYVMQDGKRVLVNVTMKSGEANLSANDIAALESAAHKLGLSGAHSDGPLVTGVQRVEVVDGELSGDGSGDALPAIEAEKPKQAAKPRKTRTNK